MTANPRPPESIPGCWDEYLIDMSGYKIARDSGNFAEAEKRLRTIEQTFRGRWDKPMIALFTSTLVEFQLKKGNLAKAKEAYRQLVVMCANPEVAKPLGWWNGLRFDMLGAEIAKQSGKPLEAEERLRIIEQTYKKQWNKAIADDSYTDLHELQGKVQKETHSSQAVEIVP
jgi:hypothetical protein